MPSDQDGANPRDAQSRRAGSPGVAVPGRHRAPHQRRVGRVVLAAVLGLVAISPVLGSLPTGLVIGSRSLATASGAPGLTSGTVRISGAGFGHGVGLSQYGARGQAAAGRSAVQILQHYYTGVTVTGYPDRRDLAVNVVHGGTRITLTSTALAARGGGFVLLPAGGGSLTAGEGDTVTLTPSGSGLAATLVRSGGATTRLTAASLRVRWEGTRAMAGPATTLDVASTGSSGTKSRRYRWGSLMVTPVAVSRADPPNRSRLEAVAVVDLHNEYLRGIAEVPSSWPTQALMAQIVAARNYALAALAAGTRASCGGCNLWDDTRSQVYSGWAKESAGRAGARWVAAVIATQTSSSTGLTALYHGRPIIAYYSSSTGGRTRDAAEVWGTAVPYLRSVSDPWSVDPANNPSFADWHRTVSVSRVLAAFGLADLASLQVTGRDDAGAATKVTARSSSGRSVSHSGGWVRRTFGLPADWITGFVLQPPAPVPSVTPSSSPGGSTLSVAARPPHSLVPASLSPVYSVPGARQVSGRSWRTTCVRLAANGAYRCTALVRGTKFVRNGQGLWGPVPAWVQARVSYFDRDGSDWRGNPRATPGRHRAAGQSLTTTCSPARATGHRICRTLVLTSQVARHPRAGGGYLYYRHQVWALQSVVYLS